MYLNYSNCHSDFPVLLEITVFGCTWELLILVGILPDKQFGADFPAFWVFVFTSLHLSVGPGMVAFCLLTTAFSLLLTEGAPAPEDEYEEVLE